MAWGRDMRRLMNDLRRCRHVTVYILCIGKHVFRASYGVLITRYAVEPDIDTVAREEVPPSLIVPRVPAYVIEVVHDTPVVELEPDRIQRVGIYAFHGEIGGKGHLDVLDVLNGHRHLRRLPGTVVIGQYNRGQESDDLENDEELEDRKAGYADATKKGPFPNRAPSRICHPCSM